MNEIFVNKEVIQDRNGKGQVFTPASFFEYHSGPFSRGGKVISRATSSVSDKDPLAEAIWKAFLSFLESSCSLTIEPNQFQCAISNQSIRLWQQKKNRKALELLYRQRNDSPEYDEQVWTKVKEGLEAHNTSYRKRFKDENLS